MHITDKRQMTSAKRTCVPLPQPGLGQLHSPLEEQTLLLLTEPERQTMAYYVQEYREGHIAVEALAMALFELFNTHAKVRSQMRC